MSAEDKGREHFLLRAAVEAVGGVRQIAAWATGERPTSPYSDVAEEAMWHVGYTAAQVDVLAILAAPTPAQPRPTRPVVDDAGGGLS